jgi:hypothetical protein
MKISILATLVLSCMFAVSMGTRAQDAPKTHTMTGCLRAGSAPNTYMLSDVDKVSTVGIVSSDANLAPHVGHKIDITGTAVKPADAEMDKSVPKAAHYMKVSSIKMVSPTCP